MIEFVIGENDSSLRADRFLIKSTHAPSSLIYKAFRKKDVKINGKWVKEDYVLNKGDILRIYIDESFRSKKTIAKCPLEAKIEYEDENIIVFYKPKNLPCQPDLKHKDKTLSNMLKSYLYEKGEYKIENENSFSPALCNRIDTNTEGLVIGAKNAQALRDMNMLIRLRQVKKYYLCRVEGVGLPSLQKVETFITKDESANISKISDSGKSISMEYRVLNTLDKESEVEVLLHTGRSHQIRAYFSHLGHPLVGDKKYGAKSGGGQSLISYKINFDFEKNYNGVLSYLRGKEIKI